MAVEVDGKFARFGSKTFAINKITSIDVREQVKPAGMGWVVWVILALFTAMAGVAAPPFLLFAALFAFFAYRSFHRSKETTTYRLFLVTAGNETQAFETTDAGEIADLRASLEEAMAAS